MSACKKLCGVAIVGLTVLLGAETGAAENVPPPWTGPKTVLKLGVSGRPDQAFLELAIRRGYFDQQGIQIETVPAGSGNDFVAPLAMNQLQVASGSPNASLFNALNRGIDIRIVADFAHLEGADDGLVAMMVRSDLLDFGAVKTAADLKGKKISLGTGRGQYSYMLTNTILEKNGIAWPEVNIQNLAFADTIAAMSNKVIDAGFMIEPLIAAAQRRNVARILVKGGSVEDGAHLSVLVYLFRVRQADRIGDALHGGLPPRRPRLSQCLCAQERSGRRHRHSDQTSPGQGSQRMEGCYAAAHQRQRPGERGRH